MSQYVDILWLKFPLVMRRVWLTLGIALGDGAYLRQWPRAALALPVGGFCLGAVLGAVHPGSVYTYSFAVVALMLALGALGAGMGVWTWAGFVLVDFVATDQSSLPGFAGNNQLFQGYLPLVLSYLMLGVLLVVGPVLSAGLAAQSRAAVSKASVALALPTSLFVYVGVVASFSYVWAQATPFMIRPLWSFAGSVPDTAAVQPIQANPGWLALVAAFAGATRGILTWLAARRPGQPPTIRLPPAQGRPLATGLLALLGILVRAGLLTLLLGGLVSSLITGMVLYLLLCALFAARVILIPKIPRYTPLVRKIPLLIRVGFCLLVSYLLSNLIAGPAVTRGEDSFASLVIVIVVSLILAAFLLPGPPLNISGAQADPPMSPPAARPRREPGWPGATLVLAASVVAITAGWPQPAYADNCSGLTDCSAVVNIGLVVVAIVLVAVAIMLLPEILAAAGTETAAEALGGMAAGGGTGATELTAAELAAAAAAAESTGIKVGETVTTAQINTVETHLSQFGEYKPNNEMISRIQDATAEGRPLHPAEQNFMQHELTEAELVSRGMTQPDAHEAALTTHPECGNYHPDVIRANPSEFGPNWYKYWGIPWIR